MAVTKPRGPLIYTVRKGAGGGVTEIIVIGFLAAAAAGAITAALVAAFR